MPSYETGLSLELTTGAAQPLSAAEAPRVSEPPPTFSRLMGNYSRYVLGLLPKLGVSPADAQDVAQEVYLAAYKRLPTFEGRSSIKTWLSGICAHKAADHRRKCFRRQGKEREAPVDLPEAGEDPCEQLMQRELGDQLQQALLLLPDEQRTVFVLHEVEELPMVEVAAIMSVPLDTAYSRHRTARLKLRALLGRASLRSEVP